MVLEKLYSYMQMSQTGLIPHTIYKNKLKMDLNVRLETIKLLEENMGVRFLTSVLAIFFWICLLRQGKQKQK